LIWVNAINLAGSQVASQQTREKKHDKGTYAFSSHHLDRTSSDRTLTWAMSALENCYEFVGHLSEAEKTLREELLAWETRSAIAAERRADRIMETLRRVARRLRRKVRPG
jgi:hypothetical protein